LSQVPDDSLRLGDLEAIQLLLHGTSIVDWNRAHFETLRDVDQYLRLHMLDSGDAEDRARLRFVFDQAAEYLEQHIGLHFPADLRHPTDIRHIFMQASQAQGFRRRQILACAILKLMHVINHLEAADLRFQTSLSEAVVLGLAKERIDAAAARMIREGHPIVSFHGGRKTRPSLITKLLAKKENTAATIFDKLRFRLVTETAEDVVPSLRWLTRHLFPFNYVIPGQSHNSLIDLTTDPAVSPELLASLSSVRDLDPGDNRNPASGQSYKIINFIVDFPVRIDHLRAYRGSVSTGKCVYALVEFQVIDQATTEHNDLGENAHVYYKQRQREQVEYRLRKGGARRRSRARSE